MKAIINRRLYDTDTAKWIGTYNNGYPRGNFDYCREELYRKKNGEFFLLGAGGARSRYAKMDGDWFCGGREIVPLSFEEAEAWASRHLDPDEYLKYFTVEE